MIRSTRLAREIFTLSRKALKREKFGLDKVGCLLDNNTEIAEKDKTIADGFSKISVLDSSSKVPAGILKGNVIDLGMHEECLHVKSALSEIEIRGRHCSYWVRIPPLEKSTPIDLTLSICVPDTCSPGDLLALIESTRNAKNLSHLGVGVAQCSKSDEVFWDWKITILT